MKEPPKPEPSRPPTPPASIDPCPPRRDEQLEKLIDAWPGLSPEAKRQITERCR